MTMKPRNLLLIDEDEFARLELDQQEYHLIVVPSKGTGGAVTEVIAQHEVLRFGFPEKSRNTWFQVFKDPGGKHNALTLALERIIFARKITCLYVSRSLRVIASRGVAVHPHVQIELIDDMTSSQGEMS